MAVDGGEAWFLDGVADAETVDVAARTFSSPTFSEDEFNEAMESGGDASFFEGSFDDKGSGRGVGWNGDIDEQAHWGFDER